MITIASIELENFQCFKGVQRLNLEAKAYGIDANHIDDAERSNWLGKSTFLESIAFCLYGKHRHRFEDDWITHGCDRGAVRIELSTGLKIERKRVRGSSTRLVVSDYGPESSGVAAQDIINKSIGLDYDGFMSTGYFEQKQHARFIYATPSERASLVSSWARMDALEDCVQEVSHKHLATQRRLDSIARDLKQIEAVHISQRYWIHEETELSQRVEELRNEVQSKESQLRVMTQEFAVRKQQWKLENDYSKRLQLEKRLLVETATRDELHAKYFALKPTEVVAMVGEYKDKIQDFKRTIDENEQFARDGFDGVCPVMCLECPVKAQVQASVTPKAMSAEKSALAMYQTMLRALERDVIPELEQTRNEWMKSVATEAMIRTELASLPVIKDAPQTITHETSVEDAINKTMNELNEIKPRLFKLESELNTHIERKERRLGLKNDEVQLLQQSKVFAEAARVFGKNGAQRVVGSLVTQTIEQIANEVLGTSLIELNVKLNWEREGKGFASTCVVCGGKIGSDKKPVCMVCGAARTPKLIAQLHVELSNQSGAAEDLAGIALQVAASYWMRTQRDSAWSVAMIDEPFGALDASHRRALSSHATNLFGGQFGFAQSFVIAHHASILDALPGRIRIMSDGTFAQVTAN